MATLNRIVNDVDLRVTAEFNKGLNRFGLQLKAEYQWDPYTCVEHKPVGAYRQRDIKGVTVRCRCLYCQENKRKTKLVSLLKELSLPEVMPCGCPACDPKNKRNQNTKYTGRIVSEQGVYFEGDPTEYITGEKIIQEQVVLPGSAVCLSNVCPNFQKVTFGEIVPILYRSSPASEPIPVGYIVHKGIYCIALYVKITPGETRDIRTVVITSKYSVRWPLLSERRPSINEQQQELEYSSSGDDDSSSSPSDDSSSSEESSSPEEEQPSSGLSGLARLKKLAGLA